MNAFIRLLYAVLIALAVLVFVGVSVYSIYQPPKAPEYPKYDSYSVTTDPLIDTQSQQHEKDYQRQYEEYQEDMKEYQQNVTMIVLPLATLAVIAGLYLLNRLEVIGEGLALGGIATSVYATISSSIADARILRLAAVTILLVSTLLLAQRKFIVPVPAAPKKTAKKRAR